MQSELLYRRYLNKGDIFIHADLKDAMPFVVKNRAGAADAPISPSTLSQAGNMCVATSIAWDSKAIMAAYWVHANQVSKTADNGAGILATGDFQIKGEKHFLAPSQLVLGFSILFQISQESIKNHKQRFEAVDAPNENLSPDAHESPSDEPEPDTKPADQANDVEVSRDTNEEQENVEEDEEKDEEEEDTNIAARNPLQRGNSEASVSQNKEQGKSEDESHLEKDNAKDNVEVESESESEAEQATEGVNEDEEYQEPEDNANEEAEDHDTSAPLKEEEKLSARERRTLRQGKKLDRPEESAPARVAPTRGKRAKEKRAAAKYAHQDDEERELALRLLGAGKGKAAKAAQAAEAKAQRDREAEAQKERRRAQHERAAQAEKKHQALFAENGGDDYNEETAAAEAADLSWIPALIGTPTPDDEILAALPVCAPWGALGRYKYKVKLQPGTVKKGKAVKEIVGRWVAETTTGKVKKDHAEDAGISRADAERVRGREGELIKGWKDTEIINTMPVGKVRIMTAGSVGGGGGDKGKGKGGGGGKGPKGGGKGGKGGKKK